MSSRAPRLTPDERRAAILAAALPVLIEHGRGTTTKQIAEAAGIAEGTIFRVFATKEELVDAALEKAFDASDLLAGVGAIDPELPLRERLLALTTLFQRRFLLMFQLMAALGVPPPAARHRGQHADWKERAAEMMVALIEPDSGSLRVPPQQVARVLRLLTFAGSHPHITDRQLMTPEEIVDVVLDGVLVSPGPADGRASAC
jgi:AcrR family transcriptional regulator